MVQESSPARKMQAYCGEEGREILEEEIRTGVDLLATRLCNDLGLSH